MLSDLFGIYLCDVVDDIVERVIIIAKRVIIVERVIAAEGAIIVERVDLIHDLLAPWRRLSNGLLSEFVFVGDTGAERDHVQEESSFTEKLS